MRRKRDLLLTDLIPTGLIAPICLSKEHLRWNGKRIYMLTKLSCQESYYFLFMNQLLKSCLTSEGVLSFVLGTTASRPPQQAGETMWGIILSQPAAARIFTHGTAVYNFYKLSRSMEMMKMRRQRPLSCMRPRWFSV